MSPTCSDDDLRTRFRALRRREAGEAPALGRVLADAERGRRAPRARRWPVPLVAAAAATAAALWWWQPAAPPDPEADELPVWARGTWSTPTDALLRTPGLELLENVPTLGSPVAPGDETGHRFASPRRKIA